MISDSRIATFLWVGALLWESVALAKPATTPPGGGPPQYSVKLTSIPVNAIVPWGWMPDGESFFVEGFDTKGSIQIYDTTGKLLRELAPQRAETDGPIYAGSAECRSCLKPGPDGRLWALSGYAKDEKPDAQGGTHGTRLWIYDSELNKTRAITGGERATYVDMVSWFDQNRLLFGIENVHDHTTRFFLLDTKTWRSAQYCDVQTQGADSIKRAFGVGDNQHALVISQRTVVRANDICGDFKQVYSGPPLDESISAECFVQPGQDRIGCATRTTIQIIDNLSGPSTSMTQIAAPEGLTDFTPAWIDSEHLIFSSVSKKYGRNKHNSNSLKQRYSLYVVGLDGKAEELPHRADCSDSIRGESTRNHALFLHDCSRRGDIGTKGETLGIVSSTNTASKGR